MLKTGTYLSIYLPPGLISKTVISDPENGAWVRIERGELSLTEFAEAFSKECSKQVHVWYHNFYSFKMKMAYMDTLVNSADPYKMLQNANYKSSGSVYL